MTSKRRFSTGPGAGGAPVEESKAKKPRLGDFDRKMHEAMKAWVDAEHEARRLAGDKGRLKCGFAGCEAEFKDDPDVSTSDDRLAACLDKMKAHYRLEHFLNCVFENENKHTLAESGKAWLAKNETKTPGTNLGVVMQAICRLDVKNKPCPACGDKLDFIRYNVETVKDYPDFPFKLPSAYTAVCCRSRCNRWVDFC